MQIAWQRNMGCLDQILRLGIGLLLIHFGFIGTRLTGEGLLAVALGVFGIFDIAAALARWCPLYILAGIDTLDR